MANDQPTRYRHDFASIVELEGQYLRSSMQLLGSSAELVDDLCCTIDLLKRLSNEAPPSESKQVPIPLLDFVRYQFSMAVLACLRGHGSTSLTFARAMVEASGHACRLAEDPSLYHLWEQNSSNGRPDRQYIEAFKIGQLFPDSDPDRKILKDRYAMFSLRTHPSAVVWAAHRVNAEREGFVFDYNDAKTPADVLDHFVLIIDTLVVSLRALRECWGKRINSGGLVTWDEEFRLVCDRIGRHVSKMRDIRNRIDDLT